LRWRVLLFAGLRDAAGAAELEVEVRHAGACVADLRAAAEVLCPALARHTYRVAIEARYAGDAEALPAAAEIAFLPPVSGG